MPRKKKTSSKPFHLRLPATSANLGPAFDTAALAMDFYLTLDARPASKFSIAVTGRDRQICQRLENHLILTTYREVLEAANKQANPLAIRIKNAIPIGKGCGSSAAARLAGVALANHFGGLRWNDAQIVGEASRREQHPDNASACWMGGLTIARMSGKAEAYVVSITPRGKWPLLLAIPQQSLSTEKARAALPAHYSRADAVINIQNSMLLLAAFVQRRPDLLSAALEDRLHQPYRAPLCPLLPCLQKLSGHDGILGAVLSGAGPSVLMFLDPKADPAKVVKQVASHLEQSGLAAELLSSSIAEHGARHSRQQSK